MQALLLKINTKVKEAGGQLSGKQEHYYRKKYRHILQEAEIECPPPDETQREKGQRGRLKRTKSPSMVIVSVHPKVNIISFLLRSVPGELLILH